MSSLLLFFKKIKNKKTKGGIFIFIHNSFQCVRNYLLGHSMSDHPKKMKFETAPPQILIKLYTIPLCDYNRKPVVFLTSRFRDIDL